VIRFFTNLKITSSSFFFAVGLRMRMDLQFAHILWDTVLVWNSTKCLKSFTMRIVTLATWYLVWFSLSVGVIIMIS